MHKNKKAHFKKLILSAAAIVSAGSFAVLVPAETMAAPATVTEFTTPSNNGTWGGIAKGADGNVWYVENPDNKIAKITPAGVSTDYTITTSSSDARFIAKGADGNMWFTEFAGNKIGRITPSGTITEFAVTTSSAGAFDITTGPDGNVWFTEATANKIAKITPSGTVTEFPLTAGPFGITTGPDGNLWVALPNANEIAKVTTAGVETDYTVPTSSAAAGHITAGPDGNVWITERDGNKIAKITPSGAFTEYPIPTSGAVSQGIALGPDNKLWFTESTANKIGSVTTNGVFTETAIPTPSSGSANITAGADGNMWFNELGILVNKIGKVTLPLAPVVSNSSVTATTGSAKTFNLISGVSNNPSAATLAITAGPSHGTASVNNTTGVLSYTSTAGFTGSDSITYKLCSADDTGQCGTAVLGISVTAAAPDTGFGVYTSSPLKTLAIFGTGAVALLGLAAASRKFLKN